MKKSLLIAIICLFTTQFINAQERKDLSMTIYNQNLGVVREKRIFDIKKGISEIRITDIPSSIEPTSVLAKFDGTILEQNFQYDLVDLKKILSKYIGKEITLTSKENSVISGNLLSALNGQIVIQTANNNLIMISDYSSYTIQVKDLPEGLITKPTLVWKIKSEKAGTQEFEITYKAIGLNWNAEYVALLNENDTRVDVNSWVSLNNLTGGSFPDTELKLIAGDVNIINENQHYRDKVMKSVAVQAFAEDSNREFEEKSLFEYHIYNLQRKTTLMNNENKQISLFNASNVTAEKKFKFQTSLYNSSENNKVGVFVEFKNSKDNNLGLPMPKGKFRIFKSDGKSKEFVGEDLIDHTPKDEDIKLRIGEAFDIRVDQLLVSDFSKTKFVNQREAKFTIKNHKEEKVVVEIEIEMGWGNWEVTESNYKFEKKDAHTALFKIPVAKDENNELKIKVKNTYKY